MFKLWLFIVVLPWKYYNASLVLPSSSLPSRNLYKTYQNNPSMNLLSQSVRQSVNLAPNIIFIVADDLGYNDVSFHGSGQMPTFNIDAMAADGVILSNYYVNPICTPSRSSLMTGYYPIHTGMQHDVIYASEPWGLPLNFTLLPQHLNNLGYESHAIGKWHLGFYKRAYTPLQRGFKTHFGYYLGHEGYYDHLGHEDNFFGYDLRDDERVSWENGGNYATEIFTERAVKIIQQHNVSKPLFLYLSHLAVHAGTDYNLLEVLPQYLPMFKQIPDVRRRLFAGMLAALDDSVGRVFNALYEAKMLDNTIVVFTTDNGGAAGGIDSSVGSNYPLRGTKYTLWEGGVKGVCAIWSPLLGTPRGARRPQLIHMIDWLPTLYEAAGGSINDLGPIDGVSFWSSLVNGSIPSKRDEILLNIDPILKMASIRSQNFKLVSSGTFNVRYNNWFGPSGRDNNTAPVFLTLPTLANNSLVAQTIRKSGRTFVAPTIDWYLNNEIQCGPNNTNATCQAELSACLFDIVKDPCEYNNLANTMPDVLLQLQARINFYMSTSVKPLKVPSDPRANPENFNFTWSPWL